jgi:hypothetical protein
MAQLFIGIIEDTKGNVLHEHFAENADDTCHIDVWDEEKPIIQGEFRKWHHVEKLIKEEHPTLRTIRYEAGDVPAKWLIGVLSRK